MATLLGDGWLFISAGGFLVSCALFVFLLGQYRAAVESEDEEPAAGDIPPTKPVPVLPQETPEPQPLKSAVPASPSVQRDPLPNPGLAAAQLQSLKNQIDRIEREMAGLKSIGERQGKQHEAIMARLSALDEKLEAKPEPKVEVAPAKIQEDPSKTIELKVPAVVVDAPEPVPVPSALPDETVVLEPAVPESPKPARKGPVWPI